MDVRLFYLLFMILVIRCSDAVMVDMTYEYRENFTAYWPGDEPRLQLQPVYVGNTEDYWYALYKFSTVDHAGTHLDAPSHFSRHGMTVEKIPLDKLVAPAVVIDISKKANTNPDSQVLVQDIQKFEENHGRIPTASIVLMKSGWGQKYDNKTAYFGTNSDDVSKLHFPGFHHEAATWLMDNRDINGIGVDTASIDYGTSKDFLTHRKVLERGKYGLENLKNIHQLPSVGAILYVMPMKITGASGAPTRVMAKWNGEENNCFHSNKAFRYYSSFWTITVVFLELSLTIH